MLTFNNKLFIKYQIYMLLYMYKALNYDNIIFTDDFNNDNDD